MDRPICPKCESPRYWIMAGWKIECADCGHWQFLGPPLPEPGPCWSDIFNDYCDKMAILHPFNKDVAKKIEENQRKMAAIKKELDKDDVRRFIKSLGGGLKWDEN